MKNRVKLLITAMLLIPTGSLHAKIVANCGAASGKVFYAHPDHNKWEDDTISKGRTLIDVLPNGEVGVIFRDALNRTVDVRDEGGATVLVGKAEDWVGIYRCCHLSGKRDD